MSIAVLNEVYKEVRRLAIAGSVVAPGDFRLKKLVDPLKKAGAKAPVFAKVAECVEDVVNSTDKTAANSLLNLGSLVCSILFTQGSTGLEGKLETIQSSAVEAKRTQISARMLKPLIEALTSTGSGRLEQIRSAIELGLFADLRLVRPALKAIDDVYGEIGDLVAERVLPMYGKAILADLKATFDLKGKSGHARRLKLMHRIDAEYSREIIKEALSEGSPDVKVAAIECLGDSADDLSYLIEQAKAKSKEIRQAAYHALCKLPHPEALEVLVKAMDGKDLAVVAHAVHSCKPTQLAAVALDRAKKLLVDLQANKDKKKQGEEVVRFLALLGIVETVLSTDAQKFLRECVQASAQLQKVKSTPGGTDIIERMVAILAKGDQASVMFLVDQRETVPMDCFDDVVFAALRTMSPGDFYKIFSPYLKQSTKKNSADQGRRQIVWNQLSGRNYYWHWHYNVQDHPVDTAWLYDAIAADDLPLACSLANSDHAAAIKYFTAKLADRKSLGKDPYDFASAMLRIEHPESTAFVIENIKTHSKKKAGYEVYRWLYLANRLGADALPELEAMAGDSKIGETVANRIVDAIAEIRERTKTSSEEKAS
ncbi:MAG: HEAT repeat domain-containing protein [Zavarzinella sp.]